MSEQNQCLCPQDCDCQNPPPDDWDQETGSGVWHTSEMCPVHNDYPEPNPECPLHGGLTPLDFWLAKQDQEAAR